MRNRGSVVLVNENKVALIKRVREGVTYFVLPGGGIEDGETPEEAAKREALEELGVTVKVKESLAEVDFNGTQFFFLCEIIGGTFGTGQGEEYTTAKTDRGTYRPTWIDIHKLESLDVRPREVADKIMKVFTGGEL